MNKLFLLFLLLPAVLFSQEVVKNDEELQTVSIKKATASIVLDGQTNEADWMSADIASDLWMKFPTNVTKAPLKTEVKFTYDDKKLYIAVKAYEEKPGFVVSSLKRDKGLREGDGVGIVLDPVNQKTNGFYFSVSPFNTQTEGLVTGSDDDVSFTWDNKWFSETKVYDGYWEAEIAIPFSILRYDAQKKIWGLNIIRANRKSNEFHTWSKIPLQFRGTDLGYLGSMVWDNNPPLAGKNLSINPYVLTNISSSKEENLKTSAKLNAGFDAKIGLGSALNLDLTVNPDFSQVDVDRQVTNLTRFDIFFPERRGFFLENDDLFSAYGIPPIRPFYSRRIGSKSDENVPILFGARLSGNVAKNTRIGMMNIQTGRKNELPADNFTAVSLNQRVLDRSTVKVYFLNRNASMTDAEKLASPLDQYGRNAGCELGYNNKAGTVSVWSAAHQSFKPGVKGNSMNASAGGGYFGERFSSFIDYQLVGKNFYTDMGFVNRVDNYNAITDKTIRRGFEFLYNETSYKINYTDHTLFNRIEFSAENFLAFDDDRKFNERMISPSISFNFKSSAMLEFVFNNNELNLLYPFRFVEDETQQPLAEGRYKFNNYGFSFNSDARKNFFFTIEGTTGKFYNADFNQIALGVTGRNQPYASFGLNVEYNYLKFPEINGGKQEFLLIAPQIEWNFSNKLFWTSFLQYNTQSNNFNINSRLQWRYKPMSDMFLVYTDNYLTDINFNNQNRALVLKFNYWING
jgi:hypothetical protein